MRIILTHEQTDFDGIASLLGAALLDETAVPVLPRRINRNVRAFITIYGADIPFVDPRDIATEPINSVCLVDTQSLISIKGMQPDTTIHVIDHHDARTDIPAEWDFRFTRTGANTTVFVEEIKTRGITLSVSQATLLLLGIYEDTGSLTYSRTTPRDIRAAADLLDMGANISIINDYLNHPLSLDQQKIYDQLRAAAEDIHILGHRLIISPGNARGMDEELSTIAHKLRDLLDPDAIILLIEIRGGVQLIARSTNDNINVAQIAAHFGGGGHPRAAAALIKSEKLAAIHQELRQILPDYIQPAIRVAEIMSGVPSILSPDTPVQEIERRIQRFGYSGYPVVENGEIVGLVTRRAVDRTLSHRLNLKAGALMEAGNVHITPDASIEELQTIMTNTGWGQVPVVDSEKKTIIGIVTRTDLLKILAPKTSQSGKQNLGAKLEQALPSERLNLLQEIATIAQQQQVALYIVGGFVRDLLLDYPSLDFDLVVEGDAIALARTIGEKFGGRVTTHERFGTAKWFLSPESGAHFVADNQSRPNQLPTTLDFITARREFYSHPTALPTVERGSIKLDLHRRDFTINTLAMRLDGRHYGSLLDYWGGHNDIRQGLVRVLHSISFVDDPTRILRAVRYEQRYGFQIGKRTLELLLQARPLMARVSGDRVRHEIDNILNEPNAAQMINRLQNLGILTAIHTHLGCDEWLLDHIRNLIDPPTEWQIDSDLKGIPVHRAIAYALWLIRLPKTHISGIIKRLRFPRITKDLICDSSQLWCDLQKFSDAKASDYLTRLEKIPNLVIYSTYLAIDNPAHKSALKNYVTQWKNISPYTTGHDLAARGLEPGPAYKEILTKLRTAWIDGKVNNQPQEIEFLERILTNYH
jgi:tRNA nucleotidyltransferase (CCA-adding enzyme)